MSSLPDSPPPSTRVTPQVASPTPSPKAPAEDRRHLLTPAELAKARAAVQRGRAYVLRTLDEKSAEGRRKTPSTPPAASATPSPRPPAEDRRHLMTPAEKAKAFAEMERGWEYVMRTLTEKSAQARREAEAARRPHKT